MAEGPRPLIRPDGRPSVRRRGAPRLLFSDLYHYLKRARWSVVLAAIVLTWTALNGLFAALYLAFDAIEGARPGSFADAFSFSVQTSSTIGYGAMTPRGLVGTGLMVVESIGALLCTAMATGLIFTKFATPTARVLFTKFAVITTFNGRRTLMLRLGNARESSLVEASVHVTLGLDTTTIEGHPFRVMHDLRLVRSHSPLFGLTWTVMHVIDERSPLHGMNDIDLARSMASLIVSMTGIDEALATTVHARHAYGHDQILCGHRLADVISQEPDGGRVIDYGRFHDVEKSGEAWPAGAAVELPRGP